MSKKRSSSHDLKDCQSLQRPMDLSILPPTYSGHRSRITERFISADIRSLPDYEIVEMLLFKVLARADTKRIAKELLRRFKSLPGVIFADAQELKSIPGVGDGIAVYLRLLADLFSRLCVPIKVGELNVLDSWVAVLNYCQFTMGFKREEAFRVLLLNKKNTLLADELVDAGTVDRVAIYPREIAKRALLYGASAVILVHNHPSGDCQPSKEDVTMTGNIQKALDSINVAFHDHIIVAGQKHFSFRSNGLIMGGFGG